MGRTRTRDIEAVALLREPTRRRLYEYVTKQTGPVSRDQAAAALHMSRPAAAFHLDQLVKVGLLRAGYRRLTGRTGAGAGRPSKLYRRGSLQFALTLPPREHELLARFLAQSIEVDDETITPIAPAREFGEALGARARHRLRGAPTAERLLSCVETLLRRLGFAPSRQETDIRMDGCPFDPLSRRFPQVVCGAGIALVQGVIAGVGAGALRVDREPDEDRCCVVLGSAARPSAIHALPVDDSDHGREVRRP